MFHLDCRRDDRATVGFPGRFPAGSVARRLPDMTQRPVIVALFALLAAPAVAQESPDASEPAVEQDAGWTVKVIELEYADAFEVAELLSRILPPGVRVVPYGHTNSIVVSGDAATLRSVAPVAESTD